MEIGKVFLIQSITMRSEQDLLDACQRLYDAGKKLSVRALRKELGGGSTDRIAAALKKFRGETAESCDQKNDVTNTYITELEEKISDLTEKHEKRVHEIQELKKFIIKLDDKYRRDIKKLKSENKEMMKKIEEVSDYEVEQVPEQNTRGNPLQKSLLDTSSLN